ncbi:fatty acid cis/trans isomerase [Aliivibrio sifiae]|uniref:9-hexadecenoic acid cis-trans isomerase n=1 Tax=Aliivibrio sifiae TaxID=566293 RepID=A0A2S7X6F4_9GAMM|nr:fatty acid cis/trans isomerase [Aliivibrio sifiae]PQJ86933.1 9-hexadecenoic acid cis-trans isomerase [Aliivibrio sifiae]GLR73944.1 9-hexadecenoic acid cis-trans isomerase [Aliivibrio sifiae]
MHQYSFKIFRRATIITFVVIFSGCATYLGLNYDYLYGKQEPQPRIVAATDVQAEHYTNDIKPIIDNRCVVCHACYDAPCQLKMSSAEGIDRGANKDKVYEGTRLLAAKTTRMFIDAQTTDEWRKKGFTPVLNERLQSPEANTQAGVIARMLTLKKNHPLPNEQILDDSWDFSIDRDQQCPTIEEMSTYEDKYPEWGMPYGLPQISDRENDTLMQWVSSGAPMTSVASPASNELAEVNKWEAFLNLPSLKQQLTSRYIFEHLFVSHLYFDTEDIRQQGTPTFFKLVRSKTAPGEPIDIIATRRPYDDPKVDSFYYRLEQVRETIVDKTHMPYALSDEKLDRIKSLFIEPDYTVTALPSYEPTVAANPLMAFNELPVEARYKFMLDDAQNTIMAFIKGPVCRGQLALDVINDHFWVFFVDPDLPHLSQSNEFYRSQAKNLTLPAERESNTLRPISNWIHYAKQQGRFLRNKNAFMDEQLENNEHLTTKLIWDGNGSNTNASLTIFRHFDNASVVQGLIGEQPKTAWVVSYSLLERIHYLLVAGYDVYGNFGHQLITRMYMDLLRMEGESNFLALLPTKNREEEFADWYQDANLHLAEYLEGDVNEFDKPTEVIYKTDNPKKELLQMLKQRVEKVMPSRYLLESSKLSKESEKYLLKINQVHGESASIFPELTFIMVEPKDRSLDPQLFTLVRNSAHKNISSLFDEESNRVYERDTMTLVNGLLGSYPNAFWRTKESELPALAEQVLKVKSDDDYKRLLDNYGVRRTDPAFWSFSDALIKQYKKNHPINAGVLDYNRFQNR